MPRRFREPLLVVLALLLYWLMAASVSRRVGVTADEVVHLTAGYSYWKFNDYRLQPENGTLPMRLAALPLLGLDLKFPPLDDPRWVNSKVNQAGSVFFYELGNPLDAMLQRARAMIALFGVLTCWLTWRWARGLFGRRAGAVALTLAIFCPALLAQGGLVTSDMAFTACALAALSAVWLLLHRATWLRLLAAIVACGACFLSKMSGSLIVPIIGLLWLLRCLRPAAYPVAFGPVRWLRRRGAVAATTFALLVVTAAGSLALVWANYGFRYEGPNRARSAFGDYYFSWDVLLDRQELPWSDASALAPFAPPRQPPHATAMTRVIEGLRERHLLPEAYLWGLAHTYKFSRERPAYFWGQYGKTGWPLFFPAAFLLKTTLPALLLFLAGVAAILGLRRRRPGALPPRDWRLPRALAYRAAPLVLFALIYWVMAIRMTLNLGHRHIVPVYPAFYIFAAAAALWLTVRASRLVGAALLLALAAHAADSWAARPFYLAYFQPLVGGPWRASHYFVESSLDWGQGLPDLQRWIAARRAAGDREPVFLSYFGADSARGRGLDVTRFGDEMNDSGPRVFPAHLRGGWYVISATWFRRTSLATRNLWGEREEKLYQQLLAKLASPGAYRAQDAMDLETLQYSRLCHWLGDRRPLAVIADSLFVFHLPEADVRAALYGPVPLMPDQP